MSEAWLSFETPGQPRKYRQPADDPNRREVMIYMGVALTGEGRSGHREVCRCADGRLSFAADWKTSAIGDECRSPLVFQCFQGFFSNVRRSL